MEKHNYLAQNLNNYKSIRNISAKQLAKELDIPQSTLSSILKDGNTTLDTVLRISEKIGIGLDSLVSDSKLPDKLIILNQLQRAGEWLEVFPPDKREEIAELIAKIWDVMGDNDNENK